MIIAQFSKKDEFEDEDDGCEEAIIYKRGY